MVVKTLEVRDRGTFIPVLAIKLVSRDEAEHYLLRRAGYSSSAIDAARIDLEPYVILVKLVDVEAQYDSFCWSNRRTMTTAHQFIIENFDALQSGQVVDVEFISGESQHPKTAERLSHPMV